MAVAVYLLTVVPLVLLRAFVLTQLWAWFVVPFDVPQIGLAHAAGISLLVSMLTAEMPDRDSEGLERVIEDVFRGVMLPLLAWGFGAIYAGFMS